MKKMTTLRNLSLGLLLAAAAPTMVSAQAFTENFDDITTLPASGWSTVNMSTPVGTQANWFQGNATVFPAQNGATNAYIGANFNFVSGNNTIGAWLITPNRTFKNGDVITFYTRKGAPDTYPDRLEVRMSTNGSSTDVGVNATTVGDFSTLLLSVNPSLVTGVYPVVWTQYTITISGLAAPTSGRIAFRYFVTSGGPLGANSDYIGIDNVVYTPYTCPTLTLSPSTLADPTVGTAYTPSLSQTGALGTPGYAVTAGALPPGVSLAPDGTFSGTPTTPGTSNFTVTVADASGCFTSTAYSITTTCPADPTSLNGLPTLCSNDAAYTLTEGLPAGGSYSGTGVSGGSFDPASGTQMISYDYNIFGCAYSVSSTLTVNTAPVVSQSPLADACDNEGLITLTGGSPAGGSYSGAGVSGGDFDPSVGSQTLTYTYIDGNGCANSASASITVNTAPSVTQDPISDVCEDAAPFALSGGLPAGGTYSGTGVSGGDFDPASGTQTITYDYTDANGCSNAASTTITVLSNPSVTHSPITSVCSNDADVVLSGGSPAGGVYSGTGVSGGNFDPSVGTQTITYSYTDSNGCTGSVNANVAVFTAPTVTLNLPVTELCVYNNALTLTGGSPASGTYTGTGVSGGTFDPSVAGLGTHTVTYDYTDANNCSNTATDIINVDDCASVSENETKELVAYPNPGNGQYTIALNGVELAEVRVVDLQGKTIDATIQIQQNVLSVDLTKATKGTYLLQGNSGGTTLTVRLVKQ